MEINHFKINHLFFLIFLVFISYFREPIFFDYPRIWAEEGLYYQSLIDNNLLNFFITPHLGYYSLINNFIVFIGKFFPINYLAHVFTYSSYIFTLIILVSPFIIKSMIWQDNLLKFLLSYFILTMGPSYVWLNFISLQFTFAIFITLLFFKSDNQSDFGIKWTYFVFSIGCLTGVISLIFAFLFFVYSYKSISKDKLIFNLFLIFLFCLFIQTSSLLYCIFVGDTYSHLVFSNITNLLDGFNNTLFFLVNPKYLQADAKFLNLIFKLIFIIYFTILFLKCDLKIRKLILIFLAGSIIITFLSIDMKSGPRYAYPISFLLILIIFRNIYFKKYQTFSYVMLCIVMIKSFDFYFFDKSYYDLHWKTFNQEVNSFLNCDKDFIEIFPQTTNKIWKIEPLREQQC